MRLTIEIEPERGEVVTKLDAITVSSEIGINQIAAKLETFIVGSETRNDLTHRVLKLTDKGGGFIYLCSCPDFIFKRFRASQDCKHVQKVIVSPLSYLTWEAKRSLPCG